MSVLCAHRGASGNFPENTMSAFNGARSIGVKWIETDISLTSDNQLIIFHDNKLGRTARGEKKISNLEFQDLKNLDIGIWKGKEFKGERIVSLNQLLLWQEKHKISINYEIKFQGLDKVRVTSLIAQEIKSADPNKIIISSFSEDILKQSIHNLPNFEHALIAERLPGSWKKKSLELNIQAWHLNAKNITKKMINDIHSVGLKVRVYTVNDKTIFEKMTVWGVDMIMSDYPESFYIG
ncbi:MAG: glycerophosphodiester phosphodiesterase family protein [Paracoccaceae bacterium]